MSHKTIPQQLKQAVTRPRGFAAMKRSEVARITSMGGNATVKRHGSKHMAKIGRKGGLSPKWTHSGAASAGKSESMSKFLRFSAKA